MEPDEKAALDTPAAQKDPERPGWGWITTPCLVVNATGYLAHIIVTHKISDKVDKGEKVSLATGKSFQFLITTGSGYNDYWDVSVDLAYYPDKWFTNGQRCNILLSDVQSDALVHVILHNWGGGWNLQCPVSDSCLRIGYNES